MKNTETVATVTATATPKSIKLQSITNPELVLNFGGCKGNRVSDKYVETGKIDINGQMASVLQNGKSIYTVVKLKDNLYFTSTERLNGDRSFVSYVKPAKAAKAAKAEKTSEVIEEEVILEEKATFEKGNRYKIGDDELSGYTIVKKFGTAEAKRMFADGEIVAI